jgi:hypothetical protein
VQTPLSLEDARRIVADFVDHDNTVRLHSAIGYVTPLAKLEGRERGIFTERDRKLAEARERRRLLRQKQHESDMAMSHDGSDMPMSPRRRPSIDFAALKESVALADVLGLLRFQPSYRRAAQQRGPCPIHGSKDPRSRSFSANVADHTFHCFKCHADGNALDLWAITSKQDIYSAATDLCRQLGRPLPTRDAKRTTATPSVPPPNREEAPVGIAADFTTTCSGG